MVNKELAKYIKENTEKGYTLEQLRSKVLNEGYTDKDFNEVAKSIPIPDNSQDNTQNTTTDSPTEEHKYKYQHLKSPRYDQKCVRPFWQYCIAIAFLGIILSLIGWLPQINNQSMRLIGYFLIFFGVFGPFYQWRSDSHLNIMHSFLRNIDHMNHRNSKVHQVQKNEDIYFPSVNKMINESNVNKTTLPTKKTLSLKIISVFFVFMGIGGLFQLVFMFTSGSLVMSTFNIIVLIILGLLRALFLISAYGLWKMKKWAFDLSMVLLAIYVMIVIATPIYQRNITNQSVAISTAIVIFLIIESYLYKYKKHYKF